MSQLPIDIDAEAVYFEGHWYTRDDLARRIKAMLDAGDFAITRPSQALEELTTVMGSVRTLAFRATPDLVEAVNSGAARAGKSVGSFIRDALGAALGLPSSDFGSAKVPVSTAGAPVVGGAAAQRATTDPETPQATAPVAGPGAMRAAQNDRLPSVMVEPSLTETAVELTQPKKKEDEAERRWFNS